MCGVCDCPSCCDGWGRHFYGNQFEDCCSWWTNIEGYPDPNPDNSHGSDDISIDFDGPHDQCGFDHSDDDFQCPNPSEEGLSTGAIVGIAVGSSGAIGGIAYVYFTERLNEMVVDWVTRKIIKGIFLRFCGCICGCCRKNAGKATDATLELSSVGDKVGSVLTAVT